jgi:hypothetical protein
MNENEQGIVLIEGFGQERDPETGAIGKVAVYLNGELVGAYFRPRDAGFGEDASTFRALAQRCASLIGLPWKTSEAHAQWALTYEAQPPATLREYVEGVQAFYAQTTVEDAVVFSMLDNETRGTGGTAFPWGGFRLQDQVRQMYSLSGGDLTKFAEWYGTEWEDRYCDLYQEHLPTLHRLRVLARSEEQASSESDILRAKASAVWRAYLADVWHADKPLDPLAVRAGMRAYSGALLTSSPP